MNRINLKAIYALLLILSAIAAFTLYTVVRFDSTNPTNPASYDAGQPSEQISDTRLLLNSYCTIIMHGIPEGVSGAELLDEAFGICERLETLFSVTTEGSDIWRVNHAGGEPVTVDPQTIEVITRGLQFGELSGGMFDITIGRLSRLWDFSKPYIPTETERAEAQLTVNYGQVTVMGNALKLEDSEAWIDLGGIAKGYIADEIAEYLAGRGVEGALIDLGGDVVVIGNSPDGNPWLIGIRKPFGNRDEYTHVLEMANTSITTSGVYERQFEVNGVRYHHILDPFTGMPVESDVISATIVADSAVTGEGLSTIAVLVGSEQAEAMLEQTSGFIGAVLVLENGEVLTFGDVEFVK